MTKIALISTGVGILFGAISGYFYYHYIGCESGTCVITSKPLNSTLYGSMMGGLVFNMFVKNEKSNSGYFFFLSLLTKWLDYKVTTQ
jgi:hypothetical protein